MEVTPELLKQWENQVYQIARYYVSPRFPLDELAQIGMIGLSKALETYMPGYDTKLQTWIYIKVRGEIRHAIRDGNLIRSSPHNVEYIEDLKSPENACDDSHILDAATISVVLGRLTNAEKCLICMRCVEQMSFPEIARRLGITRSAAAGRFRRAVAHARDQAGDGIM